jgi:fatty-acid desaturase
VSYHFLIVPVVAVALTQIASVATSVYLHRGLAHRALRLHPITALCFRAVLWVTTGQSRRQWVAVHRKHHAFTAAVLHAFLYVVVVAPLINGLGHWRGTQNFANTAYNSRLLAWVTGGESLHNNHHAYPRAPKFSMHRFEFDPSWLVIRCLARCRLVEILGTPVMLPPPLREGRVG